MIDVPFPLSLSLSTYAHQKSKATTHNGFTHESPNKTILSKILGVVDAGHFLVGAAVTAIIETIAQTIPKKTMRSILVIS